MFIRFTGFVDSALFLSFLLSDLLLTFLQDERASPQGESPVDFQASEPHSGWDGITG